MNHPFDVAVATAHNLLVTLRCGLPGTQAQRLALLLGASLLAACAGEDDAGSGGGAGLDDAGPEAQAGGGGAGGVAGLGGTAGLAGAGGSGAVGGSGASGATGGSGAIGGTGAVGGAAGTSGTPCEELDHGANDTETSASVLQPISDCDDDGRTLEGTLSPGDVDWFTFVAEDKTFCSVNPMLDVTTSDNVKVCVYFACDKGNGAEVSCPGQAQEDTSPEGRLGCCSTFSPMEPDLNCGGTMDEAAQVWIEVSWPGNSNCRDYTIDYHY